MFVRLHERAGSGGEVRRVVAVCDEPLLGKRFESEGRVLDLSVHRAFYEGERADAARVAELLKNCNSVNAVGVESVECVVKVFGGAGFDIGGVPVLQVYKV